MRIVHQSDSVLWIERGVVLSETLHRPGKTDSLHDVLAATLAAFCGPGGRCAVLGFAAGGLVAPLRAMNCNASIAGVDLDSRGPALFRNISSFPIEDVCVECADASDWLFEQPPHYDVILDDLSIAHDTEQVAKPETSWRTLPELMSERVRDGGTCVLNLLPEHRADVSADFRRVSSPFRRAATVHFDDYENVFVLGSNSLPPIEECRRILVSALERIGSNQSRRIRVNAIPS
ncbi:MAG: hypothetical protein AAF517_10095 [Planctomycetota bacterium]